MTKNITHSMAHYLLAIHDLKEKNGYARQIDIAKHLKLTKGSVSTAITTLKKKTFIQEDENHFLMLTDIAHLEVHGILSARKLVYHFLKNYLGVSEEKAKEDSCQTEHLFSQESLKRLFDFMKKTSCSTNHLLLDTFKSFEEFKKRV